MNLTLNNLEKLYSEWNKRIYVEPDPLQFLYSYTDIADREIVGMIASSLAYGRVASILSSVEKVLQPLGTHPGQFIRDVSPRELRRLYRDFKHRFTDGNELADFFITMRHVVLEYGSLEKCFISGLGDGDTTVLNALGHLVDNLCKTVKRDKWSLLAHPGRGSAVKRLNLFLRWMIRNDEVDPGGWNSISPSLLVIPLDTHMYSFGKRHGLTERSAADIRTAIEITDAFRKIRPDDPVRYDFSITRFGIRGELCREDLDSFLCSHAD